MGATLRARVLPLIVAVGFVLTGCAASGPPFSDNRHARHQVGVPHYTVAPYQVNGVRYYPKADYSYDETGTASWYGPGFDRHATADGEIYDMNQLSAAHKILPLPSMVEVTNLQNGRALRLRVNDRGPFVGDRLIDVSRRSAQLLGFETSGTTPVRVRIIKDESIQVAAAAMRGELGAVAVAQAAPVVRTASVAAAPSNRPRPVAQIAAGVPPSLRAAKVIAGPIPSEARPQETAAPRAPPPEPASRPALAAAPRRYWPTLIAPAHAETLHLPRATTLARSKSAGRIFVQAGAFAVPANAQRVRARIAALGSAEIVPATGGGALYLVRLGPLANKAQAARLLGKVMGSGYPGARVITE
jgi:rare lipoprotein A